MVHADLIYDSAASWPRTGVRSVTSERRSLVFQTNDTTIDLVVHGGPDTAGHLYGQVIQQSSGDAIAGARVFLHDDDSVDDGDDDGDRRTDACGMFSIELPGTRGLHELRVVPTSNPTVHCEIPELPAANPG